MRRNCAAFLLGLFLWLMFVSTAWTQNGYTWQLGAQMPGPRQELATGALNGNVYVLGGFDADGHSTDTVLVYNPSTDTWTLAHPLPYGVNHNSAAVAGGALYSFGAGGGELFVYNQNTNSWAARASSHYVHSQTAAVGVIDNKIYVAGGTGTPSQRELEVYDPVANTWTVKAPMSVPRNHTAGGVIEGKFYVAGVWVFGGEDVLDFVVHAEVEVYNPATNSLRQLPNMPAGRHGIWASAIGNEIYIPGGGAGPGGSASNTNQIYTVDTAAANLGDISTRAFVQTGDNVMIGGFIVQGTGTKRVIIRAIGPELGQYGVPNPLADPTLELHDGTGAPMITGRLQSLAALSPTIKFRRFRTAATLPETQGNLQSLQTCRPVTTRRSCVG